ncbi:MAG: 1-acyl-sn-glycerol-3-phosphate acyltransferase [Opitutales bacterium]|nr:1-acyl-sn-glycerol-3-phosphate acyltransferase [Opitutales bacterium]
MRLNLDFPAVENDYFTEDQKLSWWAKKFPSLCFYRNVLRIVTSGASLAKKGLYDDVAWVGSSQDTLKSIERSGIKVKVTGLEHVLGIDGPCVVIGNHMSTLETFVLPYLICPYKPVTFVIKKSLVEYPVFKHIMISRDPIVVGRESPREDLKIMLEGGKERLEKGTSLIVFPQTTRTSNFDPEQFNSIGVKIAKKAGVPVVPLALKTDAWGTDGIVKDFGKIDPSKPVYFEFAAPLEITGNGSEQQAQIVEHIQAKLKKWATV